MRLRVLTFNVRHDAGDPRRTGLLNRELRRLAPDLVAFQEVCYPDAHTGFYAVRLTNGVWPDEIG